jgi:hypothetical protein
MTNQSINRFHWLQATVARGLSTDELIMLSGFQFLKFAVVYAVWGPYDLFSTEITGSFIGCEVGNKLRQGLGSWGDVRI